ncbi:helix-turn-helix domain-containing protein [Actinoallomurus iriomotensis]
MSKDMEPPADFDDLLTPREAAALLGVRTTTVARWARDGVIKPAVHTPGGHRRYRRGEVLALRTANTTERRIDEDAARLYDQGWPIRRVAAEFGVGYGMMRRILVRRTTLRSRDGQSR